MEAGGKPGPPGPPMAAESTQGKKDFFVMTCEIREAIVNMIEMPIDKTQAYVVHF